ncbi:MOP flippase family protein [Duganella sp. SAP-35]|uniref:MOP flippase family protein n=2 Tax=Duganella aceris TaxID=2703883 RepID=A0ABX0FUA7_9BURK|nr:MOP flippase family protein [Duganella aceris]
MKAVRWNFASTALGAVVGLVQLWILSRILPPHEYGVISLALMVIQFLNIFLDFGITNSIVRRAQITELELSSLYAINLAMGAGTFLAAYLASDWMGTFFKSPELVIQIKIMAFGFLLAPFAQQQRAIMVREMHFNFIAMVAIVTLLVNFAVVVGLALVYREAWVASVSFLVSTALSSAIFFRKGLTERKLSFAFQWESARPHLRYAIQLVSDSLINVVSVNTYPALMARLVDLTAIGGYNIAYGISINLIDRLKPVLMQALFPAFAKIQDDDVKLAKNFLLVTSYASLINFPLLTGLFVASTPLVHTFFKPEWYFIDDLVRILCLIGMFRSVDVPVISLLLAKAKMYLNVRVGIFKLVIGIALAYWLGKNHGIIGIAYSFLIVQASNTVFGYYLLVRPCLPGLGRAYFISVLIPLLQVLPICVVAGLLTRFPPSSLPMLNLALIVVGGGAAYVLGLLLTPFAVVREFVLLAGKNVSPKVERLLARRLNK